MEHPYLSLVKLFELIGFGHFAHAYPHVIYTWFVMILLIVLGAIAAKGVTMVPTKMQNLFEMIISGIEEFMVDQTGDEGRWFFPILGTIFLYIFTCNIIGLVPTFFPPTANINTTVSCAITVFVFTHFIGFKCHGLKYYQHFMGPVWWLSPLILPIELISHLARVLSLSMRLFGNMMGHETVLTIFFALAGLFLAPLPIMAMGVFVAFVQAFIFFLLSTIYFMLSMEHAH
ncbi:MAG: F0F1 ATP synthase subunit A [Deltaproteobacteria bacterium]|nr:F0F1 ATP synthase subunit A [Deltaproteobacteria bacterium]MBW2366147.1 F0F1 ATP synthase subunit A [Deltaproteobacteria bacterium]